MASLCSHCHRPLPVLRVCPSAAAASTGRASEVLARPTVCMLQATRCQSVVPVLRSTRHTCALPNAGSRRPCRKACLQRVQATRGREDDDVPEGSAIEVEGDDEEVDNYEDYEEPEDEATQRANKLAELEAADSGDAPLPPDYKLNFLWFEKTLAIAVDQVMPKGQRSPVTSYFLWPHADAWEELKDSLDAKPWVSERDTIMLLNRVTEVINYWQEEGERHELDEARSSFPDCVFSGA